MLIPPQILEVGAIVVTQRDGLIQKHGPSFASMADLVLASRSTTGVLERIIGVLWAMELGVITINGGLSAIL